jgi:uncharacterized circularly permuted ATP-grasp superfamily protein/uncharacterized alpha-E superfamily protein
MARADGSTARLADWLARYRPLPGVPDELIGPQGKPRAHWLALLMTLAELGDSGVEQRFSAAGRRVEDMGMTYRLQGAAGEKPWSLSRLPLLLPESEWRDISEGVAQRAELLDCIMRDVYGDAKLIADGALPAAVVAGSPEYARQMCGAAPRGGRWLRFYAADLGRGPDGKWWVLGDKTQAPIGAGYALENRLILSRAFPSLYRDMQVRRLAGFFRDLRAGLVAGAGREEPRICLMTAGRWSETYAEQAFLARYLGLVLVEGEDMLTRDGALYVRTIAGLKRVDAIWRRVAADWCDPLEANAASRLGVPGLFDTIRRGAVAVANMPGAGLIESPAMMSFLPSLAERMLGESLRLPNVATWWCGQEREREETLRAFDTRAIGGAFGGAPLGAGGGPIVVGSELSGADREHLRAAIRARGMDFVGQEIVHLSTTPVWNDGVMEPRPFALRVFAAATRDGWSIMPGGYCRVSERLDARAVSIHAGASLADVWVLGDKPAQPMTLLPRQDEVRIVRIPGHLPSRAADNLFWMGRYLERAEATVRVARCLCNRLTEAHTRSVDGGQPIGRCERLLYAWGAAPQAASGLRAAATALATSDGAGGSALEIAGQAKHAASIVRERLSPDVWQLIGRLENRLSGAAVREPLELEILESAESALHTLAALSGLLEENFNRVVGWPFVDLGKRVERAINTCRFARQFTDTDPTLEALDALLELIDSQITYRARYLSGVVRAPVLDMAVLDPFNPRSVAFQARRIDEHLLALPKLVEDGVMEEQRRLAATLRAELEAEEARALDPTRIFYFEQRFLALANAIASRYFLPGRQSAAAETRLKLA